MILSNWWRRRRKGKVGLCFIGLCIIWLLRLWLSKGISFSSLNGKITHNSQSDKKDNNN